MGRPRITRVESAPKPQKTQVTPELIISPKVAIDPLVASVTAITPASVYGDAPYGDASTPSPTITTTGSVSVVLESVYRRGHDGTYDEALVIDNRAIVFVKGVALVDAATATMLRRKGYVD